MGQPNLYPLDILKSAEYKRISNGSVQTAVSTIATQLTTFRFAATVVSAANVLRDLVEDILRAQGLQVFETITAPAASAELLVTDSATQTALGTIRTYFAGLTPVVPPTGALPSKQSFPLLCNLIEQSI